MICILFLDNKSLLRFQFIHGKQTQAFFNGRLEVILEFTPNTVDSHIAKGFWFRARAKRSKGACTVISRSFPPSADVVAWPVQR